MSTRENLSATASANDIRAVERPGFNPLYLQVKRQLLDRIANGEWRPGEVLPSEFQLADQLGVSQGTVRKALDALAGENLLVRKQGRGTFVAEHDQARTLFQFFKVVADDGVRRFPETVAARLSRRKARRDERERFGLAVDARIWRIVRHRTIDDRVSLFERISLPEPMFPGLDAHEPLPNNVYGLYEKAYGVSVARAAEKLRAVAAEDDVAKALGCASGSPVLLIDRVAYGLTGSVVELRQSFCLTDHAYYLSDLS